MAKIAKLGAAGPARGTDGQATAVLAFLGECDES